MIKKEQSADAKKMLISSLSLKIDANNTSSINECIEHFTNLITQFSGYITAMSPSRVNAIFGAPIAYLDHTLCACLAAYRIQQIVQTTHLECKIHIGIDTFEVMVTGKEDILAYEPIQDTIDLSEKLADVAEENQIRYTASSKTFIHEYVIMTVVENTILSNIETPLPSYVLTGLQLDKVQEKLNRQYYADSYFVGREKEMEQFDHLWQQTKQGGSEVLAVRAKAGIGKTRLFHECAWHAQDDGGKVYSVAALSQEKGIPFSVLRRLVSLLCKLSGTIITEEELKRSLGELSMDNFSELLAMESIYSLFDCIVEKSEWNGLAPILQKKILFNTINDFIALMSKRRAVLLIIEDLQWCDVESLEYVQDFLKSQQEFTCLLLNYREKFHVTKEFHERVSEIELHPLSDNNATKLISHLLPETYEFSHVHKKIMALSGGNPLFIEVYIKVFNEIHRSASTEHRDIDSISNTIEETILLHVSQLNSVDKLVLQQASILGQSFSITLLHYINELAANTLTTSVMRLMEEKMFKRISLYPEPEYSFNHAYIQETLYESISRQTRDTYHQRLVMMLERNYKSKDIRMSLLMAEHAYLGHLWDKALQYYNRLMPSVMGMDFPIERYLKMGEHVQKCFDKMSFTLQKNCFPEYGRATAIYIHTLFISGNGPEAMNHIDKLLFLSRKAHQIVFEVLALGYKVILLFYMNHSTQAHALEDEIQEKLPQALHDFPELMRHSFEGMVYMMLAHPDNALGHYEAFDRKIELGLAAVKDYPYTHAPEYLGAALIPVLYLHMSYSHSVRARWDRLESVLPMLEDLEKILPIAEPLVITSIVLMTYFYSRGELKKSKLYASHSLKNASLLKLHFFYLQAEAYLAAIAYYQKDYDLALKLSSHCVIEAQKVNYGFLPQYVLLAVEVLTHCDEEYIAHTIVMDIIRLAESDNQTPLLAQAYGMQGLIYALSNKTMQADTSSIELFSKAQKLATEMKSYAALPWIALHQMEYYQQINDSESSQRYYQQALQLFTQYGMEEWRHYFLTSKGIKPTIQVPLQVTYLIIDIQGSTALIRDKDIEQGREWVEKALLIMQEEIQTLGGEIIQTAGDGVTACFYGKEQGIVAGIAALTVQKKLQQSKLPLKARAGIHASILRYGGKEDLFSEHDMFITQYIESLAPATEVYISHRVSSAYEDTFIMDDFIDTKLPDKPLFIKVSRLIDVKTNIDLVALKKQYQERVSAATTTTHELSGEKKNITSMFIKVVSKNVDIHSNLNKKFLSIAEKAIRQYSGTLIREMGNSLFAIFGAPVAFEDHSLRACLAAYSIKESLGIENNVTVYMGLHSGEAVVDQIGTDESRQYDALGIAVNLAARMMQTASENSIQLTRSMANRISQYIVIDNIMPKTLKGFDHPIATCQLVSILSEKIRKNINRQLYKGTHFVGRDYEKRLFMDLWQSAIRQYKTQCLAIRADPGMGKTRLSYEYAQKILNEGGKIYAISSSAYEQMEGFSTVVQLLKDIFNLGFGVLTLEQIRTLTEEVEKKSFHDPLGNKAILSLLGVKISDTHWVKLDATLQKKIIFDSVVDLLNEESKTNPLLLFFEDLHWCDEDSLNFITFLVTQNRLGSCMIVLDYRPEFTMPDEMKTGLTEIVLEPLSDEYSRELLEYLLPGEDDLSQLKNAISTLSQGNPFFIEEYINTILTQGGIIKEKNKYRLNPNYNLSELPPTIQGVISSRVDQLPKESKYFLQQASVLGRVFQSSLLRYLCGLNEADFKRQLTLLEEKGFLVETALFPQPEYTFKHAHICDAVYKGMLIKQKKEEHARIVEQIEVHEADRLPLFYSILAEHAYQAALWLKALHYYNEMVPVGESLDFPNPRYLDVEKKVSYCFQELTDVEKKANFDAYGRVMMRYLHACLALTRFDLFEMGIKKMLAESIHYENKLYEMLVSVYKMAALFASVHASSGLAMCKEILNFIKQDKGISLGDKKEEVYLALYTGLQHIFWATGNYALFDECVTKGFELLKDKPFYYYSELIGLAPAAILYFHLFVCHSLRARFDMIEEKLPYLQAELSKVPPSEFAVAIAISFGIYEYSIGKLEEAEMKMTTSLALSERMHLNFLSVIPRAYLACIKYYKGNKSQAILYAKNSIEMYKKMHYGFSSYVAILLSEILARCGCYEEALEVISDIMTLAVADNHQLLLARCYSFKALTYSLMTKSNDKEDEILELLAKAQAITRELGCNSLHPNIELIYVEFYKHLNQPEKAKEHYQKALNYFEEYHMMGWYEYYKNKNIDVL